MYCTKCGSFIKDNVKYCSSCGKYLEGSVMNTNRPFVPSASYIGFSSRINDPAFAKYLKNTNRYALLFATILAIIAIVGFTIYGEKSSEMDNPEAFFIGVGIGCMFLVIALLTILGRKRSKTWDGTVVDKTIVKKRRKQSTGNGTNDYYWVDYLEYTVVIRENNGKTHEIKAEDDDTRYNYYQVGDRIRHHGKLNSYEKYDKTGDLIIFCSACATLCDIEEDKCPRCNCPLLK